MRRRDSEKKSFGRITSGLIAQDNLSLKTIEFVCLQLPAWRDDPNRPFEESEPKLNSQLCDFLDAQAKNLFSMVRFKHEEPQSGRRTVDLSAKPVEGITIEANLYTIYDPIVVFECKRLPAPSSDRETEYVTGGRGHITGGIQRFKLGVHGPNLNVVAMIGYIQKFSTRDWHSKINSWITDLCNGTLVDDCAWVASEELQSLTENSSNGTSICRSNHSRTDGLSNNIEIHHLFVVMSMASS